MIPFPHLVQLSLLLLVIGLAGVFLRKDAITVFLSVEIILNAANVLFVGYARARGDEFGQVAAFIVIAVAAVEAAVGLALVIRLKNTAGTLDLNDIHRLKG